MTVECAGMELRLSQTLVALERFEAFASIHAGIAVPFW